MTQSPLNHVYEVEADLVPRFNALPDSARWEKKHGRPRYNRWKVYRLLKACKVEFTQEVKGDGGRGTKIYITHRALVEALGGDLINSLLDVEALTSDHGAHA